MPELQLGDANMISKNFRPIDFEAPPVSRVHETVNFDGGCIAIASFSAGQDMGTGGRQETIVSAFIDDIQVAQSGDIDLEGSAGHNSAGPTTLTIAVPTGRSGKFVAWGGNPKTLRVTLVRNAI